MFDEVSVEEGAGFRLAEPKRGCDAARDNGMTRADAVGDISIGRIESFVHWVEAMRRKSRPNMYFFTESGWGVMHLMVRVFLPELSLVFPRLTWRE